MSFDFSTDLGGDEGGGNDLDLDTLLNEDEEQNGGTGAGAGTGAADKGADDEGDGSLKKANALLAQQLADSQRKIQDLEKNRSSFNTNLEQTPPKPAAPVDRDALKKQLAQMFVDDPGEALLRTYESARASAIQEMQGQWGSLAQGNASLDINQYRTEKAASDPQYKAVQNEFDALVSDPSVVQQMAGQTPEQRRLALDFLYDAAFGRAQRKAPVQTDTRDRMPPSYGGGRALNLGTQTPNTFQGKALNDAQKEYLRVARESGITDKKTLKESLEALA